MEVDENHFDPESNFRYLVQQVETQSDLCDVTVKVGVWEKKFHRCILAASPFLEVIINGQFADKQNGIIEMKIEITSDVVEMACMFLYGKKPAITTYNVESLLELAEFFILPGLKYACIKWLNTMEFTEVNCMYVIQLSTKYNFDVTSCIEYIESHLPEMFRNADTVNLSKDSVEYLFSDRKFSYVQMDDKLRFLVKWISMHSSESIADVTVLFRNIDVQQVSYPLWENTKRIFPFSEIVNLYNIVRLADDEISRDNILIMSSDKGHFWCLNIEEDRWYRLNSNVYENHRYDEDYYKISGIRNNLPEVYFTEDLDLAYVSPKVTTVNLETDQTLTYTLSLIDENITSVELLEEELTNISFTDDTVVVTVNKTVQLQQISDSPHSDLEINPASPGPSVSGSSHEELSNRDLNREEDILSIDHHNDAFSSFLLVQRNRWESLLSRSSLSGSDENGRFSYSNVYAGHISEDTVEMSPLISLGNETIIQACLSRHLTVALLTKFKRHVILFDLVDSKTDIILLEPDGNYEIVQTDKGFAIYNNKRCYSLNRLEVPFFSKKYKVEIIKLDNENCCFAQYRYLSGIWIRMLRRNKEDDVELHCVSNEELIVNQSTLDINWKKLSLPNEKEIINALMVGRNLFVVPLSKSKLRCDIACPHCKFRLTDSDSSDDSHSDIQTNSL